MKENGQILLFGTLALIGALIFIYRTFILPLIRENELKTAYQNLAEPIPIMQSFESDEDFWARVQQARARFEQSGNPFARKQNPVIAMPYNTNFTIMWFGKEQHFSTVGLGRMEYFRACFMLYQNLYAIWQGEVFKDLGVTPGMQTVKGQKPFDWDVTWEDYNTLRNGQK